MADDTPGRIDDVVRNRAETAPDSVALIEAGRTVTYGALEAAVSDTASWFSELGVRPGDRVMMVCENTAAAPVLILAASRCRAWATPVNARLNPREIDEIRSHSGARRTFYTIEASPDAGAHAKRHGAETVTRPVLGIVAVGPLGDAAPEPAFDDPARQVAALMYTSGTTGAPKGVMLSHANLLFMGRIWVDMRAATPADRLYGVLPISHIYGLANGVLGAFAAGAAVELEARFSPRALHRALAAGTTLFQGVPAMYARLLEYIELEGLAIDAPALRYASAGGAAIDLDLKRRIEAVFPLPLLSGYGLTEASPTVSVMRIDDPRDDGSAGPAVPETELRIVDPATQTDTDAQTDTDEGELWVRGPQVMVGYYRDAAATAETLTVDGWLRTGDLARIDETGALWILGRAKDVIIRSGFNVYADEVEGVIAAHPDVTLCGVVGRPVDDGNEEIVAYVELAPNAAASAGDIRHWACERLTAYKRPSRVLVLDPLPATASGKVRKHELRKLALDLN